jgi:hypothetical protein
MDETEEGGRDGGMESEGIGIGFPSLFNLAKGIGWFSKLRSSMLGFSTMAFLPRFISCQMRFKKYIRKVGMSFTYPSISPCSRTELNSVLLERCP